MHPQDMRQTVARKPRHGLKNIIGGVGTCWANIHAAVDRCDANCEVINFCVNSVELDARPPQDHCSQSTRIRSIPPTGVDTLDRLSESFFLGFLILAGAAHADDTSESFFETKIRPVLANACLPCHGGQKTESGLKVDSRRRSCREATAARQSKRANPTRACSCGRFAMPTTN